MIANGDQVLLGSVSSALDDFRRRALDAGVVTFPSTHPRFSYVRVDADGMITEAAEKRVISRLGIAGLYYFRRGGEFIDAAKRVILNNNPVQGAFFVSQALNEMILETKKLGHYEIKQEEYYPLYSPQKIMEFEEALLSKRVTYAPRTPKPTLVIPMAGEGARFAKAGYGLPKPFIDVGGKPMIWRRSREPEIRQIRRRAARPQEPSRRSARTGRQPGRARAGSTIVPVDQLTEGSVCTILLARNEVDRNAPLLIANCDQIVDFDCNEIHRRLHGARPRRLDPGLPRAG